jgi:hypothetical protein
MEKNNNRNEIKKIENPEKYFEEVLWKNSEDFLMLKRLVEESDWKISWKKLKKYTKIENWKVEWIYWEEDLDLRWTSITRLWKLKRVWWYLWLNWVGTLKDLWELEEVWWYLDCDHIMVNI